MDVEEKLATSLVIVPPMPTELKLLSPSIDLIMGHSRTISLLRESNLPGLVVRKIGTKTGFIHSCLFIPAASFDRIIIIKHVKDLSRDGAIDKITASVSEQLNALNDYILAIDDQNVFSSEQLSVDVITAFDYRAKKSNNLENLRSSFDKSSHFPNLKVVSIFIDERKLPSEIKKHSRYVQASHLIKKLALNFYEELRRSERYNLRTTKLEFLSSASFGLHQVVNVCKLFDAFFPDRKRKLTTIPHLNRIEDNMLYAYNEEGELGYFADYARYMGEVRLFSEQVLAKLNNPCGVFVKSFTNDHLSTILSTDSTQPQPFQCDWLYAGNKIVAFEVGLTRNPKSSGHLCEVIQRRILQVLTRIIPHMLLMLHSFLLHFFGTFSGSHDLSFCTEIEKLFKCVIFLPNVGLSDFREAIAKMTIESGSIKKLKFGRQFFANSEQNHQTMSRFLYFLVRADENKEGLKLLRVNSSLEISECQQSVQDFFGPSEESDSQLLTYVSALISIAGLNNHLPNQHETALDLDRRYLSSLKLQPEIRENPNENFVTSPQQYRILSDQSNTHLIITGQPGCGKTSLLLSKCNELASSPDIESIIFLYSHGKELFRKFLDQSIKYSGSSALHSKIQIHGVSAEENLAQLWIAENNSTNNVKNDKKALFMDEIEFDDIFKDIEDDLVLRWFSSFKYVWLSFTELGSSKEKLLKLQKTPLGSLFTHEILTILFRSSSHISKITSTYIEEKFLSLPFPSKPVIVPGCFTASQHTIPVRYIEKREDILVCNIDDISEDKFSSRLIVIFSTHSSLEKFAAEVKKRFSATIVLHCSSLEDVRCVLGSEFQSVLLLFDFQEEQEIKNGDSGFILDALNIALSRAQYEVLIFVVKPSVLVPDQLSSYLMGVKSDFVLTFQQLIDRSSTKTDWLQPKDTNLFQMKWFQQRLALHFLENKDRMLLVIKQQLITVRIQMVAAFPVLFSFTTEHLPSITQQSSDSIISNEELCAIDDKMLAECNVLYWSCLSQQISSVSTFTHELRRRNLFSCELNKRYPNATIIDVVARTSNGVNNDILKFLLECPELKMGTLLHKFEDKNVFEYILANGSFEMFGLMFGKAERCDIFFMECIGFETGESEVARLEKYQKWGGDILFRIVSMSTYHQKAVEVAVQVLKRYEHLLQFEFSRTRDGRTLFQQVLHSHSDDRIDETVCCLKILISSALANNLQLTDSEDRRLLLLDEEGLLLWLSSLKIEDEKQDYPRKEISQETAATVYIFPENFMDCVDTSFEKDSAFDESSVSSLGQRRNSSKGSVSNLDDWYSEGSENSLDTFSEVDNSKELMGKRNFIYSAKLEFHANANDNKYILTLN
ncbi:uncharacterized protein LOC142349588 isoform X3 [Convolutriloba macropyga]|uniref:uncharacterized protein LOC142349588 isoform X3 n=1 Tax=Convolutriloba macropyga TaxID=536237 RepID=UPI003F527013